MFWRKEAINHQTNTTIQTNSANSYSLAANSINAANSILNFISIQEIQFKFGFEFHLLKLIEIRLNAALMKQP